MSVGEKRWMCVLVNACFAWVIVAPIVSGHRDAWLVVAAGAIAGVVGIPLVMAALYGLECLLKRWDRP